MKRRALFAGVLAAPALVLIPRASLASEDEKQAALATIDAYAARTFGKVRDGIKRALQTYLLDEHGRELRLTMGMDRDDVIDYGEYLGKPFDVLHKANETFVMRGDNKPGVPDVLAKAMIAWLDSTLNGYLMVGNPDTILCWRVRPSFSLTGRDFETNDPGGKLKIRARAHTWNGWSPPRADQYDWRQLYGTRGT